MKISNGPKNNIKVLLAGIEKFGPYNYNVAERISKELNNKQIKIENSIISIISVKIPIHYSTFRTVLSDAIKKHKPQICIGLGMDFKDLEYLSFELIAKNKPEYGENIKDIEGNIGVNTRLDNGPDQIRIPNENQIVNSIKKIKGIKISENAGSHICETILRDLIRLSNHGKKFQAGFIHVPHTPDLLEASIKLDKHVKAMSLKDEKAIIKKVIKVIARFYL